jgi:putative tryptophan/tyrosine transport system substrate-binding protein
MKGVRRRIFIAGLGAATWPLWARAQQDGRLRRIAVLLGGVIDERASDGFGAFRIAMGKLGWTVGCNLRIDVRAGANNPDRIRASAIELVGLDPDAIVSSTVAATRAMQQQTQDIPIIFAGVGGDPVAIGIVKSIARPEGNVTGFTNLFYSIGGKWIELLKNAAPGVTRVALVFNPTTNTRLGVPDGYIRAAEAAAPALAVQSIRMPVRDDLELVRAIDAFAGEQNGGLVALPPIAVNGGLLFRLVAQHGLPAIFPDRAFVTKWGQLMSYGSITADLYRGAAQYVDRILRGTKVSELPVQYPTKFELVINLQAAKAIGLTIPESFLAGADQVIE